MYIKSPVKSHGFAESLTSLAHAENVISYAFQLKQKYENKYYGLWINR